MSSTITQDMRFRLSVVLWAMKHGVTSAAIRYKKNASMYTVGSIVITVIFILLLIARDDRITIRTSILMPNGSSLLICGAEILIPVSFASG